MSPSAPLLKSAALASVVMLLSGCGANHNTAYRLRTIAPVGTSVITLDAKQRNVLIHRDSAVVKMCAEPSPDAFSVFAQSLGASVSGGTTSPQAIEAAASLAMSRAENGATISRTQTANVVREMMFRTCERYLSGAIKAEEFAIQAIRDQRMVVSILAIEQLTGVVTPPAVVIRADGQASTGSATSDTAKAIVDAQQAVKAAEKSVADATTKLTDLDKDAPKCADLKDDETDAARKTKKGECTAADAAVKAARTNLDKAQDNYKVLRTAVTQGGLPVSSDTTTDAAVFAGLNRASDAQIKDVTATIGKIIEHVYTQDEFLLFCIGKLETGSAAIKQACERYVTVGVDASARKLDPESFDRAFNAVQANTRSSFDRFWDAVADPANSGVSDAAKVQQLLAAYRTGKPSPIPMEQLLTAIGAGTKTRDEMKTLFYRLLPAQQSELATRGGK